MVASWVAVFDEYGPHCQARWTLTPNADLTLEEGIAVRVGNVTADSPVRWRLPVTHAIRFESWYRTGRGTHSLVGVSYTYTARATHVSSGVELMTGRP
jgi:hypothetical protein